MANPDIKNPSRIFPGQILQIPRKPEPVSADSATIVNRPERDRLSPQDFDQLGIEDGSQTRWIDVDLSSQTVSAFQGRVDLQTFLVSTGVWRTPTVTGQYQIYQKFETDDMRGPGYYLKDVPYTMYFYKDYGLHGTYWHSNFGQPMSHGCVNLSTDDARWLFEFASEGTLVYVHY
jgi:lipoprotein-anchoring transpeptidase ErfK/SrfK